MGPKDDKIDDSIQKSLRKLVRELQNTPSEEPWDGKLYIEGEEEPLKFSSSPRQTDKDGTEWPGTQIDLLLCRGDHVIDVCEMKCTQSEFVLTREYDEELRKRNETFIHLSKTKDAVHNILVTTYGLKRNSYSDRFYATVTMDDLFGK